MNKGRKNEEMVFSRRFSNRFSTRFKRTDVRKVQETRGDERGPKQTKSEIEETKGSQDNRRFAGRLDCTGKDGEVDEAEKEEAGDCCGESAGECKKIRRDEGENEIIKD